MTKAKVHICTLRIRWLCKCPGNSDPVTSF